MGSSQIAGVLLKNRGLNLEGARQDILKELDPNFTPTGADKAASPPSRASPGQAKSAFPQRMASPQPLAESVNLSKRYDVYCTDRSQGVTVYRNVRFKGIKHLYQRWPYDTLSGYVELEPENGQTVFVSRSSIIRFHEPGG